MDNIVRILYIIHGSVSRMPHAGRRGLEERLAAGETILCAEGYLLALSRMGYIAHGVWVPEFILEQPEVLRTVHYEFIHAGTDVTEAFQVWVPTPLDLRQYHPLLAASLLEQDL